VPNPGLLMGMDFITQLVNVCMGSDFLGCLPLDIEEASTLGGNHRYFMVHKHLSDTVCTNI